MYQVKTCLNIELLAWGNWQKTETTYKFTQSRVCSFAKVSLLISLIKFLMDVTTIFDDLPTYMYSVLIYCKQNLHLQSKEKRV